MKLSVPFLPDPGFAHGLKEHIRWIESIYFELETGPVLDARMRLGTGKANQAAAMLDRLGPVKKYLLLNTRFIAPSRYGDSAFLSRLKDHLDRLVHASGLTGFVFCDAYLLTALAKSMPPELTCRLEAVPGVNCIIDSPERATAFLDLTQGLGFARPSRIILDRNLNRQPKRLADLSCAVKKQWPGIRVELLANEGCLFQCPFKQAHDAHISLANLSGTCRRPHTLNRDLGCQATFFYHPERFLSSPFIRPEDLGRYEDVADAVKLCGRSLGPAFLEQAITAYSQGSFSGNLIELMDAAFPLSKRFFLDNKRLDPGFWNMVTECDKTCSRCGACLESFSRAARTLPTTLEKYEAIP